MTQLTLLASVLLLGCASRGSARSLKAVTAPSPAPAGNQKGGLISFAPCFPYCPGGLTIDPNAAVQNPQPGDTTIVSSSNGGSSVTTTGGGFNVVSQNGVTTVNGVQVPRGASTVSTTQNGVTTTTTNGVTTTTGPATVRAPATQATGTQTTVIGTIAASAPVVLARGPLTPSPVATVTALLARQPAGNMAAPAPAPSFMDTAAAAPDLAGAAAPSLALVASSGAADAPSQGLAILPLVEAVAAPAPSPSALVSVQSTTSTSALQMGPLTG